MAATLSNLLSFLTLTPPPPPKASPLPLSLPFNPTRTQIPPLAASSNEVVSVLYPSLAHANTLFFKSSYNVLIRADENESEESILRRFGKKVKQAGILKEYKRRRFFENSQDKAKRKSREVAKRNAIEAAKARAALGLKPRKNKKKSRYPNSNNYYQDKKETDKNKKDDREEREGMDEDPLAQLPLSQKFMKNLSQTKKRFDKDERGSTNTHSDDQTPQTVESGSKRKGKWNK